jgi:hypothetical protein
VRLDRITGRDFRLRESRPEYRHSLSPAESIWRSFMTKHRKTDKPSNVDLKRNPLIGGSKGTTMAGVTPDELEDSQGANTIEGDVENDPNSQGGIDKARSRNQRRTPHI